MTGGVPGAGGAGCWDCEYKEATMWPSGWSPGNELPCLVGIKGFYWG